MTDLIIQRISNLTTNIDLVNAKQSGPLELIEFDEETIGVVFPKAVGRGLLVTVECELILEDIKHPFACTGKIIDTITNLDKTVSAQIELHHFDQSLWKKFLYLQRKNAQHAEDLFARMRDSE